MDPFLKQRLRTHDLGEETEGPVPRGATPIAVTWAVLLLTQMNIVCLISIDFLQSLSLSVLLLLSSSLILFLHNISIPSLIFIHKAVHPCYFHKNLEHIPIIKTNVIMIVYIFPQRCKDNILIQNFSSVLYRLLSLASLFHNFVLWLCHPFVSHENILCTFSMLFYFISWRTVSEVPLLPRLIAFANQLYFFFQWIIRPFHRNVVCSRSKKLSCTLFISFHFLLLSQYICWYLEKFSFSVARVVVTQVLVLIQNLTHGFSFWIKAVSSLLKIQLQHCRRTR